MTHTVRAPGSCGEFIQGYLDGASFMVTCPINRYSVAEAREGAPISRLPQKAEMARKRTLSRLGMSGRAIDVRLSSEIPMGKGMASSTADISAVCMATALACGRTLTPEDIAEIAISIEPSDAIFYDGVVRFDYRKGRLIQKLGQAPAMHILVFDCGGEVDTLVYNSRKDLISLQKENEGVIRKAVALFERGMQEQNPALIGEAATMSAFANQRLLYKSALEPLYETSRQFGALGIVAAHSGTVLGVIAGEDTDAVELQSMISYRLGDWVTFLDSVCVTNEGMVTEI